MINISSIHLCIYKEELFMYLNFNFMASDENDNVVEKRVNSYELALFLKSYPDNSCCSVLETVWNKYGLIEDFYDEVEEQWYPGFTMPPTWWLVKRIRAEYGQDPLWIKVPAEILELVESVRQTPKRRWRLSGKWRKKNSRFHQPWWMN